LIIADFGNSQMSVRMNHCGRCLYNDRMHNPLVDKAKWTMKGKLPGSHSQNTWNTMKLLGKGLQHPGKDKNAPPILQDENLNPYIHRAIQKHLRQQQPKLAADTTPPFSLQNMLHSAAPFLQKAQGLLGQMNPMAGTSSFLQSGMGQMAMTALPLLLQGGAGGRGPKRPSKYMRGVGGAMRRMGMLGSGTADSRAGQPNRLQ
jgi:hypothetical protein